jgi:tetratricopeptide (TPR) repeat protein
LINQLTLLSQYVSLFFFPVSLNAHHLFDPILSPFGYRFGVALLILSAGLLGFLVVFQCLKPVQRKTHLLGLLWFVVTLLPVLVFLKRIGENVFAERYFYLPSLGLCLSSCLAVMLSKDRFPRITSVFLGLLLAILAWKSIDRNRVWQTELGFYETTAKESPGAAVILNSLGTVYVRQSRYQEAIKAFESSIASRPTLPALKNLGYIYAAVGRHEEAIATYEKAIAVDPMDSGAYAALGDVFMTRGQYSEAIRYYKKSLAIYPESTVALFKFADASIADQRYDEAIQALQTVLALSPGESSRAYRTLAKVYQAKNLPEQAAEANQKASFGPVQLFH